MKNVRELVLVSLFAAITCILSIVSIPLPFTPVPITLQLLAVTMSSAVLGKRLGFYSQAVYTLLGAVGLPVFAGGKSGFSVLFGPTGGYIFGFMASAFVIGWLIEIFASKQQNPKAEYMTILFSMVAGLLVIYTFGVIQLMLVAKLSLIQGLLGGVTPFILADIIKIALGSSVAYSVRKSLIKSSLILN
ncbi:biotin transporter BioY [Acetoanaerobium noterae]|uniref:biotin transporter BioY n=1 Tax=Acetoanaerobium noterae TaxID=745369 RepID=UPI0033405376